MFFCIFALFLEMTPREAVEMVLSSYIMPNPNGESFRIHYPDNIPEALYLQNVVCPDSLYGIMTHCWRQIPDERPTFEFLSSVFDNFEQIGSDYKKWVEASLLRNPEPQ